ncbi:MAG: ATP-dependent zinc protease [Methylobacter sp.]|uniref:ATP-dependent zinc protease family protein n=1 Tax=Methylobacter sp. TaxID=2051955 RepID=UPI0027311388|nr:ATP-dependent zinc protease [Methylobacter sp.]MDP1664846.1 ATP-dependent zinc protease [Methylobacter sp.]MDP1969769.1 ATP-dependent zinc protease [Methylobacter sp.]
MIHKPMLGWREWVALPELKLAGIKAKIDTGARSSALHAFAIEPYRQGGQRWVMFAIHPVQQRCDVSIECHAPVKDRRMVTDSGGHKQRRYVIETQLVLGQSAIRAEMTLTNRDTMRFRMLLGRTAMDARFIIDPGASYLQGRPDADEYQRLLTPERSIVPDNLMVERHFD